MVIEVLRVDGQFCFFVLSPFLWKCIDAVESLEFSKYFLLWEISTLDNFLSCLEDLSLVIVLLSWETILIPEFLLFPLNLTTFSLLQRNESYADYWGRWVKMKETYWSGFLESYRDGFEDLDYFLERNIDSMAMILVGIFYRFNSYF